MSLLGLAIIGKNNEPLYLCDCDFDGATSGTSTPTTRSDTTTDNDNDRFGFADATRARGLRDSLSLERQFMMHAALDRLEEITGAAGHGPHNGSMVGRNMTVTASSPHWMGLLTHVDDELSVYGYVTATNIKFLALISIDSDNDNNSKTAVKPSDVQKFLTQTHEHYVSYLMNPFSKLNQPIDSRKFDTHIQAAVQEYQNSTTFRLVVDLTAPTTPFLVLQTSM
jgi:hypothetical protein